MTHVVGEAARDFSNFFPFAFCSGNFSSAETLPTADVPFNIRFGSVFQSLAPSANTPKTISGRWQKMYDYGLLSFYHYCKCAGFEPLDYLPLPG